MDYLKALGLPRMMLSELEGLHPIAQALLFKVEAKGGALSPQVERWLIGRLAVISEGPSLEWALFGVLSVGHALNGHGFSKTGERLLALATNQLGTKTPARRSPVARATRARVDARRPRGRRVGPRGVNRMPSKRSHSG